MIDIRSPSYHIAGESGNTLYLGNESSPMSVIGIDHTSKFKTYSVINLSNKKILHGRLFIDSPFFYILDRTTTTVLQGKVENWQAFENPAFKLFEDLAIPISHGTLILRTLSKAPISHILAKETVSPPKIKTATNILESQAGGIFSTDGMLNYDPFRKRLVYVYYYRNQYLSIDTDLNLILKARTIDTNTFAKIEIAEINSDSAFVIAGPPRFVNLKSFVFHKYLFINSRLIADNEEKRIFRNSSVIDVYDYILGNYKFSFYISDYEGKKITDIQIINGNLVCISGKFLLFYKINSELL